MKKHLHEAGRLLKIQIHKAVFFCLFVFMYDCSVRGLCECLVLAKFHKDNI